MTEFIKSGAKSEGDQLLETFGDKIKFLVTDAMGNIQYVKTDDADAITWIQNKGLVEKPKNV